MSSANGYDGLVAATYDATYEQVRAESGDVGFYRELAAETGGPVLELGCGTGRVLLGIEQLGLECVGLDSSRAMLDVCEAKKRPGARVELIFGAMEDLDLADRRFPLIIAPFRGLQHLLDIEVQLRALRRIRRHLAPDGLFAFDVYQPKLDRLAAVEEAERSDVGFVFQGRRVTRYVSCRHDVARQVTTVDLRYDGSEDGAERTRAQLQLRWFHRFELEHLLRRADLEPLGFFGDFHRRPYPCAGEIVVVARSALR